MTAAQDVARRGGREPIRGARNVSWEDASHRVIPGRNLTPSERESARKWARFAILDAIRRAPGISLLGLSRAVTLGNKLRADTLKTLIADGFVSVKHWTKAGATFSGLWIAQGSTIAPDLCPDQGQAGKVSPRESNTAKRGDQ